jgi:ribonuclease J
LPQYARCIYSYWAGYLKQPQWAELQEKLESVGGDFIPAHTSGHILPDDIVKFIGQVNPRTVIPIHTFEPTFFRSIHDRVEVLQDGQPYDIG